MFDLKRTWLFENEKEFDSVLVGRNRMWSVQSGFEYFDRLLAEAGHAPANTSGAPAPNLPPDLIAAAEAIAMSPRAPAQALTLARRVLDLAGQGEAA